MKKTAILALILSGAVLLPACKKEPTGTRTSRKTEEPTSQEETEDTSDPDEDEETTTTAESTEESTEATAETTTEVETTTTESESEAPESTPTSETTEEAKPIILGDDPMDYYKDPSYRLPVQFQGVLSGGTVSWETSIMFGTGNGKISGKYESAVLTVDMDAYDIQRGEFTGLITGFVRENDYSYKTRIEKISFLDFDDKEEEFMNLPAHVKSCKPYGFENPDELILYLPNTPKDKIAKDALGWVEFFLKAPESNVLGAYVLYSPNDETGFILYHDTFPETEKTKKDDMDGWLGKYAADEGSVEIFYDDAAKDFKANVHVAGADEYNGLTVRQYAGDPSSLVLYGNSEAGMTVIFALSVGDGTVCLSVYESNDPAFNENIFIYPHKVS